MVINPGTGPFLSHMNLPREAENVSGLPTPFPVDKLRTDSVTYTVPKHEADFFLFCWLNRSILAELIPDIQEPIEVKCGKTYYSSRTTIVCSTTKRNLLLFLERARLRCLQLRLTQVNLRRTQANGNDHKWRLVAKKTQIETARSRKETGPANSTSGYDNGTWSKGNYWPRDQVQEKRTNNTKHIDTTSYQRRRSTGKMRHHCIHAHARTNLMASPPQMHTSKLVITNIAGSSSEDKAAEVTPYKALSSNVEEQSW